MFSKLFIASAALSFADPSHASPVPDELGPSVLPPQQLNGLLGVAISDLNVIVGVSCVPISVIGVETGST
ncbi:uncharacterized protein BXZ73DRAFT_102513 [Epithele typhae]|uniref:uncharacterized protein n=1 Tax=Epithele typhae TaxID=378194 RepID=UPI002008D716|nr:uncharacterized protein BXZ73DRAFT_102513 [Epithele typhae]KAH9928007.1 hypothetical protein BXZ73DRAFT_102513 [Epithele typhae]